MRRPEGGTALGLIATRVAEPSVRPFREVVQPGIRRGEVPLDGAGDLGPRRHPALMTYRSKMCAGEWRDAEIAALIDRIMVSLLRGNAG